MSAAKRLYRELFRKIRTKLPRDSHSYYTRYLRQSFVNFADEKDEHRIQQLIDRGRQDAEWVLKTLPLVLFTAVSSGVIVVNKLLMVDKGFRYPLFLTACGQLASALTGLAATKQNARGWKWHLQHVWPVALCGALTLFLGNYAYLFLSMAFIQILKAFTPACTFALGVALGIEGPAAVQLVSVAAIAVGTSVSTLMERGTPSFHWLGFFAFMASVVTEAARVLVVQKLLAHGGGMSASQASWLLGLPTAALLAAASLVWEAPALLAQGHLMLLWRHGGLFACAMAGSCALNWLSYLAIRTSGALTLKIVGCVKNVLVMWVGVLQGEHVGLGELGGYVLSLAGFVLYSVAAARHTPSS